MMGKIFMMIVVMAAFSRLSYKMNKDPLLTHGAKRWFHALSISMMIIFGIIILTLEVSA